MHLQHLSALHVKQLVTRKPHLVQFSRNIPTCCRNLWTWLLRRSGVLLLRGAGIFEKVIKNIRRINRFKERYRSFFPKLAWQFVVFGHNEHELPVAQAMAADLDMTFRPKLNHSPHYSPVKDAEFVRQASGLMVASRDEYAARTRRQYSFPCAQLWDSPQINWDGKLLGCCVNKYGHFGNVFETGLNKAMQDERYQYAKRMVVGRAPPRPDIPCVSCKVYQRIHAS